jgi:hypothetical protein
VYLVCGALLSVAVYVLGIVGYPTTEYFGLFVPFFVAHVVCSVLTIRVLRKPRRSSIAPEAFGCLLGGATVVFACSVILWPFVGFGAAAAPITIGVGFLVVAAIAVGLLNAQSERVSRWSGQMKAVILHWTTMPIITYFLLCNRIQYPALTVAAAHCGFVGALWFGLGVVANAASKGPGYRLLLLRCYSERSQSGFLSQLIDEWAYLGEVLMLAGPDLAGFGLDARLLARFLAGRIRRNFIHSASDLEKKLAMVGGSPSRDGRYPVVEFRCTADTWASTFQHLLRLSDTVAIDLRGFVATHCGAAYELDQLAAQDDKRGCVAIVNSRTDTQLVQRIIRKGITCAQRDAGLRILSLESHDARDLDNVLRLLIESAALTGRGFGGNSAARLSTGPEPTSVSG